MYENMEIVAWFCWTGTCFVSMTQKISHWKMNDKIEIKCNKCGQTCMWMRNDRIWYDMSVCVFENDEMKMSRNEKWNEKCDCKMTNDMSYVNVKCMKRNEKWNGNVIVKWQYDMSYVNVKCMERNEKWNGKCDCEMTICEYEIDGMRYDMIWKHQEMWNEIQKVKW